MKKGSRKVVFGALALVSLGAGFALCVFKPVGFTGFGAYATAVVSVLAAVVAGNVGEHHAEKAP